MALKNLHKKREEKLKNNVKMPKISRASETKLHEHIHRVQHFLHHCLKVFEIQQLSTNNCERGGSTKFGVEVL